MAVSVDEFKLLYPQYEDLAPGCITQWFDRALLRFTPSRFGAQWDDAVYCFTAHHLGPTGSGNGFELRGNITSEKVADLARSYGSAVDMSRIPASLMPYATSGPGLCLIGIIMSREHGFARIVKTGESR